LRWAHPLAVDVKLALIDHVCLQQVILSPENVTVEEIAQASEWWLCLF